VFCEQSSSSSYRSKSLGLLPSAKTDRKWKSVEKRRYVGEVALQFNRPSPVSYLCSVNTARPALAVSSYTRNPTESGNRRQMATPSRSNLTIRCVDLNLLFRLNNPRQAPTIHKLTRAFTGRENGPEAGISSRWRHLAEVTGSIDRPTPVCYWWSEDISRPAGIVLELIAMFVVLKTDRKRKPPLGSSA
jgi:hypothetical protein